MVLVGHVSRQAKIICITSFQSVSYSSRKETFFFCSAQINLIEKLEEVRVYPGTVSIFLVGCEGFGF